MKKILLILAAITILGLGVWYFFFYTPSDSGTTLQPPPSLPVAGSGSTGGSGVVPMMTISAYDETPITTNNFIHNGETVADVQNPGSYVLAGSLNYCLADGTCPQGAPTTDFSVSYNEQTHFFNVVLYAEPLGPVRKEAEQFVENRLGISLQNLCTLNYYVGTPYWVNESYTGKNLGFSFCSGAVPLPN